MALTKEEREKLEREGKMPAAEKKPTVDLKGFKSLNPEEAFGWFKKSPGAVCYGEYLGRFEKTWDDSDDDDAKEKWYHQVRIWSPTQAMCAAGEGKSGSVEKTAPSGSILNVDESKALEAMKALPTENNGKHVVYVEYTEKVKIPGTARTFWRGKVLVKDLKAGDAPF